jgi:arylsulfatase A-like enzyme
MEWRERGYTILVTGDHGINADGSHGGATPDQRDVPLFFVSPGRSGKGDTGEVVSHLQIAPSILSLLEVHIPDTMKSPPIPFD